MFFVGLEHNLQQQELCKANNVNNNLPLVKFEISSYQSYKKKNNTKVPGPSCYCYNILQEEE